MTVVRLVGAAGYLNLRTHSPHRILLELKSHKPCPITPGVVPHGTVLCGSYWWKDILKLNDAFRLHSEVTINMGDSVLFWFDAWVFLGSSVPLRERFPRLFSFVIDDKVSVREVINTLDMSELFHLPLSPEAMAEMITV